jgi:hypothetical protein
MRHSENACSSEETVKMPPRARDRSPTERRGTRSCRRWLASHTTRRESQRPVRMYNPARELRSPVRGLGSRIPALEGETQASRRTTGDKSRRGGDELPLSCEATYDRRSPPVRTLRSVIHKAMSMRHPPESLGLFRVGNSLAWRDTPFRIIVLRKMPRSGALLTTNWIDGLCHTEERFSYSYAATLRDDLAIMALLSEALCDIHATFL